MPILARILKDCGFVTQLQLQEAIQHQVLYGGRLGTNLHELGYISEERLQEALARALGVPSMAVDPREVQPEVVALVPKAMAARHKVFPFRLRGKTLTLLMVDPRDHPAVADVGWGSSCARRSEFRMIKLLRDHYDVDERWWYADTHRPAGMAPQPGDPMAAAARIDGAATRDEVVEGVLGLCHRFFRRVIFFIVRSPWVLG